MRKKILLLCFLITALFLLLLLPKSASEKKSEVLKLTTKNSHWFLLYRKSNIEYLYFGEFGNTNNSKLVQTFQVKTGIPNFSPTPLPQLLGRDYWLLTKKESSADNIETAPYFLTLDVPSSGEWPYGPTPYLECNGQCDWVQVGYFGLHGVNGNLSKLSQDDPGSSGCIRHKDEDITYLYNLLNPEKEEIRYYIEEI